MIFDDTYQEIQNPCIGYYKEKGSKFIAYAFPVFSEQEVKNKLDEIKKLEHSARHYCYAFVLHPDKSAQRTNDDGEPSSSAGRPILGQILSNNLTNILIVVVRYFGGIKLGIPGLIRSYKTAALEALLQANVITKIIKEEYEVIFQYTQTNDVMRLVKELDVLVLATDFNQQCSLRFSVARNKADEVVKTFERHHQIEIRYIGNG